MSLEEMVSAFEGELTAAQIVEMQAGRWMSRQLAECAGSRTRLARWARAGRQAGPFTPTVASASGRTYDITAAVFRRLPPPVAWFAAGHLLFVGVGAGRGFCQLAPGMSVEPLSETVRVVAFWNDITGPEAESLCAHEIAHAWTSAVVPLTERYTSRDRAAVRAALAQSPEQVDRLAETLARGEELAHVLSHQWGFRGQASDVARLRRFGVTAYTKKGIEDEVRFQALAAERR